MSHEPTEEEVSAAARIFIGIAWPHSITIDDVGSATVDRIRSAIRNALPAANALRDRRIRDEALEEAAQRVEPYRSYTQFRDGTVVEDPLTSPIEKMRAELADAIRALKDKTDDPAPE